MCIAILISSSAYTIILQCMYNIRMKSSPAHPDNLLECDETRFTFLKLSPMRSTYFFHWCHCA